MSNSKTIFDYYNILWHRENLFDLYSLFHDAILMTFKALDEKDKDFEKQGKRKVFNSYFKWSENVKRLKTKIRNFLIDQESDNIYRIKYQINQYHKMADGSWGMFNLEVEEKLYFLDHLIVRNKMTRFSKKRDYNVPIIYEEIDSKSTS